MAAVVNLLSSPKISGRFYYLFAAGRNGRCALGPGRSWKRESSSYEQESNQEDMPVSMENPYKEPPKKCVLCDITIDYKNVQGAFYPQQTSMLPSSPVFQVKLHILITQLLSQFISPFTGSILGNHITGLCTKKQKEIGRAIKRAQCKGFMSIMYKDPKFRNDPKICNIKYPE